MKHMVTLSINSGYIRASCSCGKFNGETWHITLDDLNGAVHDHIEAAERDLGYVTKSAVTSNDQLVSLEPDEDWIPSDWSHYQT